MGENERVDRIGARVLFIGNDWIVGGIWPFFFHRVFLGFVSCGRWECSKVK